jgi:hypothetical protein
MLARRSIFANTINCVLHAYFAKIQKFVIDYDKQGKTAGSAMFTEGSLHAQTY